MRILALDQAMRISGISILENDSLLHYEIYKTPNDTKKRKYSHEEKIDMITNKILELIDDYEIDIVAMEDVQSQKSPQTFKQLAILMGCIRQSLYKKEIKYEVIPPATWRSLLNIKGRKREDKKKNAQLYIKKKYGIEVSEDEADSICIGNACYVLHKND